MSKQHKIKSEPTQRFVRVKRGRPPTFPFEDMDIGDWFFYPEKDASWMYPYTLAYEKKNEGTKFKPQSGYMDGERGVRVKRVQ